MTDERSEQGPYAAELSERQAAVLRAIVMAHVGAAAPVGSRTVAQVLPVNLSSASVRNTLGELAAMGLVEKPHASSGRVPTDRGMRHFVDRLLDLHLPAAYERRAISYGVNEAEVDAVSAVASQLLSELTHQLGFVVAPRFDRVVLRHVSLVRLTTDQLLVVLISRTGESHRRILADVSGDDQPTLDSIAALLNERIDGLTLRQARERFAREAVHLRHRADGWLNRVVELGARAVAPGDDGPVDLVLGTRLALLEQPEFRDPDLIRDLFAAVETKERLVEVLDHMLLQGGTQVAIGDEVDEPGLHRCALVASPYGDEDAPLGALGVIGPRRMDYGKVIPLVAYLSERITEKLAL